MAGPLLRLPYWEGLRALFRQGARLHDLPAGADPLLCQAHRDFAQLLSIFAVSLFDLDKLGALPEPLAEFKRLANPGFVANALIHQLCYVADVAVHMQGDAHTAAVGVQRTPITQSTGSAASTASTCHNRWLLRYESQPLTNSPLPSCMPASLPLSQMTQPTLLRDPVAFLPDLRRWYLDRVAIGPHLAAAILHSNVSWELLNTLQVPLSKFQVTINLPVEGGTSCCCYPLPRQSP